MYGRSYMETYITTCKIEMRICCMAQETQTGALYQSRGMGWRGGGGAGGDGRELQKGGDICILL